MLYTEPVLERRCEQLAAAAARETILVNNATITALSRAIIVAAILSTPR